MNPQVLLVEDNPADARLIQEQLIDFGATQFEIRHVARLSEALRLLESSHFDLMLLDLSLPDEQGLETLLRAHRQSPGVPIVVLTGFDDEALAMRTLREGAQDYLVKGQADGAAVARSMRYAIERSRSEQALRDSEERYRFLFDNNPHPMWVFDTETLRFLAVNSAAISHYGFSREEFLAMTIRDIRPSAEIPQLLKDLEETSEGVKSVGIRRHWKKDGSIINVEITGHALTFDGRPASLVLANDVTERIRLEEQLLQSQKMEAIGRLAGGVAHDFNNLLTVITGYGQMMLNRLQPGEPMYGDMEEVLSAANRAALLTNQLLAFSRRRVAEPKIFDLNLVVGTMEKMLQRLIGDDIVLTSALAAQAGMIKADPGQIEQVIMNLVVNARDAMPRGGKIAIETANQDLDSAYARIHLGVSPGRYVMLAVSDTGRGMTEEVRRRIFEPFFTTKEPGKGTGLGLSTVYGIVKQSGGEIWVYSEPDRGTTFKLYFPLAQADEEIAKRRPSQSRLRRGVETILLVEDDAEVRTMVRRILLQQGYHILEAPDGAEAVRVAGGHPAQIHLLLTDVVMAQMSGRELATALTHARPDMKVLYMSGYTDNAAIQIGELEPGMQFIQKPFRPDSLIRKIREVLDHSRRSTAK